MPDATPCGLCELACGRGAVSRTFIGRELRFCCNGCANVYAILLESGVLAAGANIRETEVFRRSLELGLISNPGEERDAAPAIDPNAPVHETLLQVGGMWCSACSWLIEHALRRLPGVVSADVYFVSDLAKVKYCPQHLPPESVTARIEQLGYRAAEYSGEESSSHREVRNLLLRLGVAAFLWANIMAFSVILYVGYFEQIASAASRLLPWVLFGLTTPMVFYCAWPILRSAAIGLRHGQIRMEVLLSLGILTAYLFSVVQAARGQTHVYFDTAAAIITLVLAGKLIERAAKDRATRSIARLYRLMPRKVRVPVEGSERFISIDALEPGTIFLVKAGERIPADGVILEGETESDESLLSGESAPVSKAPGDSVISGSLNLGGVIRVRALRTGDESALSRIIRLVERALSTRTEMERAVDRVSRIFVPGVVIVAAAAFVALAATHAGVGPAAMRATSILVIACPCALGLATPLAVTAALGFASQRGILITDSSVLETIREVDQVIFDKTGTVTFGDFRLLEYALTSPRESARDAFMAEHLPVLAGLQFASEHLLGRAVVRYASEHHVQPVDVQEVGIHKGRGIAASYAGTRVFMGNRKLAVELKAEPDRETDALAREWQAAGRTVAYFGTEGTVQGLVAFGDHIKPGVAKVIGHLRARGIKTRLVSGDAEPTTAAVAAQIGVDGFVAEMSPEGKVAVVQQMQKSGLRVAVVGDGVNDAPALATADLGIALGTGADIAMSAAPVVLIHGSLDNIEEIFRIAKRTTQVIRQNLFWAFLYNTAGIALSLTGLLNPIVAAGAMLLSSASVVANSMRLSREAPRRSSPRGATSSLPQRSPAVQRR